MGCGTARNREKESNSETRQQADASGFRWHIEKSLSVARKETSYEINQLHDRRLESHQDRWSEFRDCSIAVAQGDILMIAPCREYWWREILPEQRNWTGPHTYPDIVERIIEKEEIPRLAATYIVKGSIKDGILSAAGRIYFEGVDHLDPQEVPEWLVFARNIERDGVTKLPSGEDMISIDAPRLVQRASEKTHPHTEDLDFNQLVSHVHNSTGIELGVAKVRVESFIEDGVLERNGDTMALGSRGSPEKAKLG